MMTSSPATLFKKTWDHYHLKAEVTGPFVEGRPSRRLSYVQVGPSYVDLRLRPDLRSNT
jgi:hypothetical protein